MGGGGTQRISRAHRGGSNVLESNHVRREVFRKDLKVLLVVMDGVGIAALFAQRDLLGSEVIRVGGKQAECGGE